MSKLTKLKMNILRCYNMLKMKKTYLSQVVQQVIIKQNLNITLLKVLLCLSIQ